MALAAAIWCTCTFGPLEGTLKMISNQMLVLFIPTARAELVMLGSGTAADCLRLAAGCEGVVSRKIMCCDQNAASASVLYLVALSVKQEPPPWMHQ